MSQAFTGTRCPLCAEGQGKVWLVREGVPAHQNRVWSTRAEARACTRGDLVLACCPVCGFIWNTAFDPSRLSYDDHYDNQQGWSGVFRNYMAGIARHLIRDRGLAGAAILEVGCGKGDFLSLMLEAGAGSGLGIDSSYEGPLETDGGRLRFRREHLREALDDINPDAVVSRHVVEHVQRPMDLLEALAAQVRPRPAALVFIETPTVRWILENAIFWDLFYEHCSYFDTTTLPWACERAGLEPLSVATAFEGQYQWVEARACHLPDASRARVEPETTARLVEGYARRVGLAQDEVKRLIGRHAGSKGGVAVWGAGAKGATLLHLIDPRAEMVRYAVDLNPAKHGKFLPATGHAVVAPEALVGDPPAAIVLMNENYRDENATCLAGLGLSVPLIGIDRGDDGGRR